MVQIACLGWGSLVWDQRDLPIRSDWLEDGPLVAVDFLRQSKDGRMTLVLDSSAISVRSLWARMIAADLTQAREDLRIREGVPVSAAGKYIGSWSPGEQFPSTITDLEVWAQSQNLQHVVWTALPAKFGGIETTPSADVVLDYLHKLTGIARDEAERYVRRAPRQIDTQLRKRIDSELNWTAADAW
ncbi:UNVERIFIED_ORG: hypothetical protein J2W38_005366 [Variovorax paradoxus]|nr:hypothetical protein [Variovorax paradoxus]